MIAIKTEGRDATHIDDRRRRRNWNILAKVAAADLSGPAAQRLSRRRPNSATNEKFRKADLANLAEVEAICEGVDGILHFGGYSIEGSWDQIHQANIIGCYNLFEAA